MRAKHLAGYALSVLLGASTIAAATADNRLLEAVKNKDSQTAHALLERGHQDVNTVDSQGMTPLLWAAHWDDLDMVKCLLDAGADAKLANRFGGTALHEASTFGDVAMMEALIKAGADPNAVRGQGDTPLMVAVHSAKPDAVNLLLEHGAQVDARDGWYGETPLMIAVSQNYAAIAKTLITHGADVNAASTAFNFRRRPMADAVAPINPPAGGLTPIFFAARQGAMESGKLLIDSGANLNVIEPGDKYTPLLTAIVNDNWDFATLLVEKGAKLDDGSLPLIVVMRNGPGVNEPNDAHLLDLRPPQTIPLMKLLIAHGAPIDQGFNRRVIYTYPRTPKGATAFSMAASFVDVDAMRLLLDNGAKPMASGSLQAAFGNVAVVTTGGMTPLMLVTQLDKMDRPTDDAAYLAAVEMCVKAGNDVNAATIDGNTALHYAAGTGNDPIVQYLIEHGANVNAKTKKGRTPLDWAEGKRPGGIGNREMEAPQESTIALLKKFGATDLSTSSATAQNIPAQ